MKLFVITATLPAVMLCGIGTYVSYKASLLRPVAPPRSPRYPPAVPPIALNSVIRVVARNHGLKQTFVKSVIAAESSFNQHRISRRGAIGLMQLMPDTARELGINPAVPEQNIEGGTAYLRWLLQRYHNSNNGLEKAIAAYNAGPGNVDKYRGIPPFRETRRYVKRVLTYFRQYELAANAGSPRKVLARRLIAEYAD